MVLVVKNPTAKAGDTKDMGLIPGWGGIPPWQSAPVCLPGKSHGQRSLLGYSPQGHKKLNMIEVT